MFFGDKKKVASIILSKLHPDGSSSEAHVAPEEGPHDEYTAFAQDFISAVKNGSVQRLASCLREFHKMIMNEDEEQDAGE